MSSSCTSSHYDGNVLELNSGHHDVELVESTDDSIDADPTSLINSHAYHDGVISDPFIKQEHHHTTTSGATMVSSTSASLAGRQNIIFECTSEAVDSTTSGQAHIEFVPAIATYHGNKITLESLVALDHDSEHLSQLQSTHSFDPISHSVDLHEAAHIVEELQKQDAEIEPVQQEHVINDLPVLSRARASLPTTYLYIQEIENSSLDPNHSSIFGVFARKTIPKRTQFGPVEGVIVEHCHAQSHHHKHNLMIYITSDLILDQSDENQSNWMKFVRAANTYEEKNLVLVAKEQGIAEGIELKFYFMTTRAINAGEELKVWYSKEYADKFNLKALEPIVQPQLEIETQGVANNLRKRAATANTVNITVTTGHKLRNKIAKTQQQQRQQQQQQEQEQQQQEQVQMPQQDTQNDSFNTTNQKQESSSSSRYKCDTCNKVFPRFYSLRRHQIMHSGTKSQRCVTAHSRNLQLIV